MYIFSYRSKQGVNNCKLSAARRWVQVLLSSTDTAAYPPSTLRPPHPRLPPAAPLCLLPPPSLHPSLPPSLLPVSLLPCCLPPSLPPRLLFPAARPHSLSFEGSGFFSCVSVFFNLDLSNFSISAMSGLSDMLAGDSAGRGRAPLPPAGAARSPRPCGAAPSAGPAEPHAPAPQK